MDAVTELVSFGAKHPAPEANAMPIIAGSPLVPCFEALAAHGFVKLTDGGPAGPTAYLTEAACNSGISTQWALANPQTVCQPRADVALKDAVEY